MPTKTTLTITIIIIILFFGGWKLWSAQNKITDDASQLPGYSDDSQNDIVTNSLIDTMKTQAITTDKTEYQAGKNISITLTNTEDEKICLYSCNPYYLETNTSGEWTASDGFKLCNKDSISQCLKPNEKKGFTNKAHPEKGTYRVTTRVATGCTSADTFPCNGSILLHSEPFTVK